MYAHNLKKGHLNLGSYKFKLSVKVIYNPHDNYFENPLWDNSLESIFILIISSEIRALAIVIAQLDMREKYKS